MLRRKATWGRAIYTEDWRYTEWGDNGSKGTELYDLGNDPHEFNNLAGDGTRADVVGGLKKQLDGSINLRESDAGDQSPD